MPNIKKFDLTILLIQKFENEFSKGGLVGNPFIHPEFNIFPIMTNPLGCIFADAPTFPRAFPSSRGVGLINVDPIVVLRCKNFILEQVGMLYKPPGC